MTTMREIRQVITDLIHHTKHNEYNDAVINMQYKGLVHMIEDYASQKKPAKEVIPRAWADYIETMRNAESSDQTIMFCADNDFPALAENDELQRKFNRAVVNGYTIEPEPKFYVLAPKEWSVRSLGRAIAHKRLGGLAWLTGTRRGDNESMFTMKEIEKYHLDEFEREEVSEDED